MFDVRRRGSWIGALSVSRRTFLKHAALASGSAALLNPGATLAAWGNDRVHRCSVGVIGAGLAGLAAAWELNRAGCDVTILEARTRVGGRVHTLRDPFVDGMVAEAGAMFAGGPHTQRYVDEFGLKLVPPAGPGGGYAYRVNGQRIVPASGKPLDWPLDLAPGEQGLSADELRRKYVVPVLDDIGNPLAPDWPPASAKRYDHLSFEEFLTQQGASKPAIQLLRLDVMDLYGDGIGTVSALLFLRDAATFSRARSGGGVFAGGSDQLPKAFGRRLAHRIRYGCAVKKITQDARHVHVTYERGAERQVVEVERVVCAIPCPVLRPVEIEPVLSKGKRSAIESLQYSSITRTYLQMQRRFWEDEKLSGRFYTDARPPRVLVHPLDRPTNRGILEAHYGKAEARRLAGLSDLERVSEALSQMETILPGSRAHFEGGVSYSWVNDPWALGGYSSPTPGELLPSLAALSRPEGRIHFAGEHTSKFSASMEGALESGCRVAHEVLGGK